MKNSLLMAVAFSAQLLWPTPKFLPAAVEEDEQLVVAARGICESLIIVSPAAGEHENRQPLIWQSISE